MLQSNHRMNISFHGAAREVTGSCYLVQTETSRILIDCGMYQGTAFADAKNFKDFGFDPSTVDAVIVTHAHLDHVGRLPKLIRDGFRGKIYMTPPTAKLTKIVLEDAEQIMEEAFRREFRPKLYEQDDVAKVLSRMPWLTAFTRSREEAISPTSAPPSSDCSVRRSGQ